MKRKPEEIISFLEEIEPDEDQVKTQRGSKAVVWVDGDSITLSGLDCQKAFKDAATAEAFYEALGNPEDAQIELHSLDIDGEVFELLESMFSDVEVI